MLIKNIKLIFACGLQFLFINSLIMGCIGSQVQVGSEGPQGPQGFPGAGTGGDTPPETPNIPPTVTDLTCTSGVGNPLGGIIINNNSLPAFCSLGCLAASNGGVTMSVTTPVQPGIPTSFNSFDNSTQVGGVLSCSVLCISSGQIGSAVTTVTCT